MKVVTLIHGEKDSARSKVEMRPDDLNAPYGVATLMPNPLAM